MQQILRKLRQTACAKLRKLGCVCGFSNGAAPPKLTRAVLPPRYSISAADGVGSPSQARFFFEHLDLSPERLPPPGAFFIRLTLLKKPRPCSTVAEGGRGPGPAQTISRPPR